MPVIDASQNRSCDSCLCFGTNICFESFNQAHGTITGSQSFRSSLNDLGLVQRKCRRAQLFRHSHLRIRSSISHHKMRYIASMPRPTESSIRKCLGRKSNLIHTSPLTYEIDPRKPLVLTTLKYVKYPQLL